MVHIKSWFPVRLREVAGGDFSWISKPAELHRLEQNDPKNLRIDSVEMVFSRTSQVQATALRVDEDIAARKRFSKMLHEKPLPALPNDEPPAVSISPTVTAPSTAPTKSSARQIVSRALHMDTQVKELEPISIYQPQSTVAVDTQLSLHDILGEVDDDDEAHAFGNFIVFIRKNVQSDRAEISMRAVDEHALNPTLLLLDSKLSNNIKHVLRAQDISRRAETSFAVKDRMQLAFMRHLKAQIALHHGSLQQDEAKHVKRPVRRYSNEPGNDATIAQGVNGAASAQQAELLILKLSHVKAEARRDALISLLDRQREDLRGQEVMVQTCLAEAFKSADLRRERQAAPQLPLTVISRESDFVLRYRTLCKQLGINDEVDQVAL